MNQVINTFLSGLNNAGYWFWNYAASIFFQSCLLIIVLFILDFMLRKRVRALFRYCLWMLVFVKLLLPTSFALPTGIGYWLADYWPRKTLVSEQIPIVEQTLPFVVPVQPEVVTLESPVNETILREPTDSAISDGFKQHEVTLEPLRWQAFVFLGWLVGILVFSVLLIQRVWFVKGLIAQSYPAEGRLLDTLNECLCQIGIRRNVELKLSNNLVSPAVCGLFKPVILMPASLLEKLSRERLRAVLIHELAHIKRADIWVNLVQTVLQIVYFYNPFVWLANSRVRRIREQAVDEMVLVALKAEAKSYSNMLIDIAEIAFWRPNFSLRLIGVVESKKALAGRIKHMLARPIPKSAKLGLLGLIAVVIIGAVLLPMATSAAGPAGFVIKGTVTDAETGQAIAGVKVGDVDEYANGRQWTITDSNGNYSYLTWYEEHGIKAEAPGYKIQHKGLYTKLFGSEKEKVLDFQLTPASILEQSKFKKTLPNGVTVELVGVCEHPSRGKQWWRPDGSLLNEIPYKTTGSLLPEHTNYKYCEFVIRLQDTDDISVKWDVPGGRQGSFTGNPMDANGQRISDLQVYTVNQPEDKKTALVRIGLSTARWQTIATHPVEIPEETYSIDEDGAVAFGRSYVKDSKTVIPITHNINRGREKKALRVVGVTYSGREVRGSVSGRGGNILSSNTHEFNLTLRDIKEFRFQTRPYEWVEFKNVSLRPGVKTDVVVERAGRISDADKRASEDLAADGWRLWRQRQLAEAEEKFKEAVNKDSTNDNAYQGLGWAQLNQGKKLNAKDSFEKCIKLNPQNSAALNGLGWIAEGQGKIDEAIGHWEKAVEAAPTTTAALSGLGQTYMMLKEYDKAAEYYQMWLNVEPNNAQAKSGLQKARRESAKKLMDLGRELLIYANDHEDRYPDTLQELRPYDLSKRDVQWLLENVEYLGKGKTLTISPQAVIAYDKTLSEKGNGTNVLFNDSHVEFFNPEQLKELGIKPDKNTKIIIRQRRIDAAVYKQLERLVELSDLRPEMPLSDALEELKNSVEPPLQIAVLWRDLYDNADIERTTPINIDAIPAVQLSTALELILQSVSGEFVELGYVVKGGIIIIATKESLPSELETNIYDATDVLGQPADYYAYPRTR